MKMKVNLEYLNNNSYASNLRKTSKKNRVIDKTLGYDTVIDGIILPQKNSENGNPPWGLGGVIDEYGKFVDKSRVNDAFGGEYSINEYDVSDIDTVIHINIIPKHWGHFLIDVVSRLWILLEKHDYPISYCAWNWDGELSGNFLTFFELLDIKKEQLICIKKPTKFHRIIIPEISYSFDGYYHELYKKTFDKICVSALNKTNIDTNCKKIYLTRTNLRKAKFYEIGEKYIEKNFRNNGFCIISPEKIGIVELIKILQNADIVVSLSGTIAHNIVFCADSTQYVVLNRTCIYNSPQKGLIQLFAGNVTYVDVYHKIIEKNPVIDGTGPVLLECSDNLKKWFKDNGLRYKDYSKNSILNIYNLTKFYTLKVVHKFKKLIS